MSRSKSENAQIKVALLIVGIMVVVAAIFIIKQKGVSYSDYMADKVIEKLQADYEPYGPNRKNAPVKPISPQATQPQPPAGQYDMPSDW